MDSAPPLQYTDTKWSDVQLPETTKRFRSEEHLWKPWGKDIHSPNMPQFLKMYKRKDKRLRFIDSYDTRYLQADEGDNEAYYFCVKKGSDRYPEIGQKIKTHLGESKKITGTWIVGNKRATGIVYFK